MTDPLEPGLQLICAQTEEPVKVSDVEPGPLCLDVARVRLTYADLESGAWRRESTDAEVVSYDGETLHARLAGGEVVAFRVFDWQSHELHDE